MILRGFVFLKWSRLESVINSTIIKVIVLLQKLAIFLPLDMINVWLNIIYSKKKKNNYFFGHIFFFIVFIKFSNKITEINVSQNVH
jgi:hypothetical protein